jgi:hypothetical protein
VAAAAQGKVMKRRDGGTAGTRALTGAENHLQPLFRFPIWEIQSWEFTVSAKMSLFTAVWEIENANFGWTVHHI